jgi:hypothetical protein
MGHELDWFRGTSSEKSLGSLSDIVNGICQSLHVQLPQSWRYCDFTSLSQRIEDPKGFRRDHYLITEKLDGLPRRNAAADRSDGLQYFHSAWRKTEYYDSSRSPSQSKEYRIIYLSSQEETRWSIDLACRSLLRTQWTSL